MWHFLFDIIILLHYFFPGQGVIECPIPDKDIRRFDANLRLFPPFIDNDFCPLTIKNTILQSCYLRNTEWVCGVAVYTGKFSFNKRSYGCIILVYLLCAFRIFAFSIFCLFFWLVESSHLSKGVEIEEEFNKNRKREKKWFSMDS